MNYTVYDTTPQSPSDSERDILWSVLLFGDKINFVSNYSPAILTYSNFLHYSFGEKIVAEALMQEHNLFVFDQIILTFININALNKYKRQQLIQSDVVDVFSEEMLLMPLCYELSANEIELARSEWTVNAKWLNECVS